MRAKVTDFIKRHKKLIKWLCVIWFILCVPTWVWGSGGLDSTPLTRYRFLSGKMFDIDPELVEDIELQYIGNIAELSREQELALIEKMNNAKYWRASQSFPGGGGDYYIIVYYNGQSYRFTITADGIRIGRIQYFTKPHYFDEERKYVYENGLSYDEMQQG